jgi:hypothetical protein
MRLKVEMLLVVASRLVSGMMLVALESRGLLVLDAVRLKTHLLELRIVLVLLLCLVKAVVFVILVH